MHWYSSLPAILLVALVLVKRLLDPPEIIWVAVIAPPRPVEPPL